MTSLVAALLSAEGGGGGLTDINLTLTASTVVLFLLFAFVLGKFAWRPLLDMIELRERTVREHVAKAEKARDEANEALAQQKALLEQAHKDREQMLLKAMKEAEVVRDEIVSRARTEADHAVERAREQIEREKTTAVLELRSHVVDIAMAAAAKIVESSMTPQAQRQLVDDFLASLRAQRN